jgi:MoxR-like ATPase
VAIPRDTIEPLLCALVAGGHVLLEGIPGIGKTLLARTIAQSIDGDFRRIQFTNDLMPSDVVGTAVWRPDIGMFSFVRGPLFANLVLADEINRTSPRTLSCLLEAMESGRVSVEGRRSSWGFRSRCSRRATRSSSTAPTRCPRLRSIVSSCASRSAIRRPCSRRRSTRAATPRSPSRQ